MQKVRRSTRPVARAKHHITLRRCLSGSSRASLTLVQTVAGKLRVGTMGDVWRLPGPPAGAPPALAWSSEYSELEVFAKAAAVECCPPALDRSSSSSLYAAANAAAVDIVLDQ